MKAAKMKSQHSDTSNEQQSTDNQSSFRLPPYDEMQRVNFSIQFDIPDKIDDKYQVKCSRLTRIAEK